MTRSVRLSLHPSIWAAALAVLFAAAIATRLSPEMNWSAGDFAAAALLLLGAAAAFELAVRLSPRNRRVIGATVLGVLLLIWAELAVGIFR